MNYQIELSKSSSPRCFPALDTSSPTKSGCAVEDVLVEEVSVPENPPDDFLPHWLLFSLAGQKKEDPRDGGFI